MRAAQRVAAAAARAPFPALVLAAALLFAAVGALVLDDYGIGVDDWAQRQIAIDVADFVAGDDDALPANDVVSFYGAAFELPLLLAERALGLQDSRAVFLLRHALSHLVFIAGGVVGALLAWRMFGSRWLGLLTMLLFLLHPRIYAHSFFNTKDPSFAAAFMLALYLVHRAFRRGTPGAFALCGAAVGLAVNLRVFGLLLLPAVLALLALDVWQAADARARRRALLSGALFAAAALLTTYALHPYYWENPLRMLEAVTTLARHPAIFRSRFLGETFWSDAVPPHYIPTWFAVTAPPVTLLLGALGAAVVLGRGARRPRAAAANGALRFQLLLLGCVVLPVLVVAVTQAHVYDDWRQMFFLWAPFSLLAAAGAQWLAGTPAMAGAAHAAQTRVRTAPAAPYTNSARGGYRRTARTLRQAAAVGAAGLGALSTVVSMAALHPHEQVYFSPLLQPASAVSQNFSLGDPTPSRRQGFEYLLRRYPDDLLLVPDGAGRGDAPLLPEAQRRRLLALTGVQIGIVSLDDGGWTPLPPGTRPPVVHQVRAYGGVVTATRAPTRFRDVAAAADAGVFGPPVARADFDVYLTDTALIYRKQPCGDDDLAAARFFLHVVPVNPADLPAYRAPHGFDNLDLAFDHSSAAAHGVCLAVVPLPVYALAHVRTGQYAPGGGEVWAAAFAVAEAPLGGVRRSTFDVELEGAAHQLQAYGGVIGATRAPARFRDVAAAAAAGVFGPPAARAAFDVYLTDTALIYHKNPCDADDLDAAQFFLHVVPANPADLPAARAPHGFDNLDSQFDGNSGAADGVCLAVVPLPDYALAHVRTGQYAPGGGVVWEAAFDAAEVLPRSGVRRSTFGGELDGAALTYRKTPCTADDVRQRFFLRVTPVHAADLSDDRARYGGEALNFDFAEHGAFVDGGCRARVALPAWPIARIVTGQQTPNWERTWEVSFVKTRTAHAAR